MATAGKPSSGVSADKTRGTKWALPAYSATKTMFEIQIIAAAGWLAHFPDWLVADGYGGGALLAAAGGLTHFRAWLTADGH